MQPRGPNPRNATLPWKKAMHEMLGNLPDYRIRDRSICTGWKAVKMQKMPQPIATNDSYGASKYQPKGGAHSTRESPKTH